MTLEAGQRLGEYEIGQPLGRGGMGEVYRARDTSLGRDVAIKVLPEALSQDDDRYARFEREAKLLAQLNHPNVATLYGFRDGYLAMELVEGETLADRIARGPIALDEATRLFLQIAEGLEAAHEKGIVHRDLKPANVKITPEGKIKVLDFGLARAFAPEPAGDTSHSPTLTRDTALGVILGTASYMSPEQARGKTVDKRTDVWAFGCCMYEALTGRKAFEGETVSDVISAVLRVEPPLDVLPGAARTLVGRCLQKDPRERLRDIGDAKHTLADGEPVQTTGAKGRPSRTHAALLTVAGAVIGAVGALVFLSAPAPPSSSVRFSFSVPISSNNLGGARVIVSPDGRSLLWRSPRGLVLRELDRFGSEEIDGTRNASNPSFSPDGRWVVFEDDGALKKLPLDGGTPVTLCTLQGRLLGAHWLENGIVFVDGLGLNRVGASGGTPELIVETDDANGLDALPDGSAVFLSVGSDSTDDVDIVLTSTGEQRKLVGRATSPRYANGYLFFERDGAVFAARFDLPKLELEGEPLRVLEDVYKNPFNRQAGYDVSHDGNLVYLPARDLEGLVSLVWVDRDGKEAPAVAGMRPYRAPPRLSPDATQLAITALAPPNVWIVDLERGSHRRLSTAFTSYPPLWSSDGDSVFYSSFIGPGLPVVVSRPADASEDTRQLTSERASRYPEAASPDGQYLVVKQRSRSPGNPGDWDLALLTVDGQSEPSPLLSSEFNESSAAISPDGTMLAFVTDETGRDEILVTRFPDVGARISVSTNGGTEPVWSRRGDELFYREGRKLMAAQRQGETEFSPPSLLFEDDSGPTLKMAGGEGLPSYDVAPDGRFLMMRPGPPVEAEVHVVVGWLDEVARSLSND